MYTSLRELYEDLLRKGDLRDLQKLRGYLELQDKIEELEKRPASEGALRKLRQQLPHLKEIISMYSNRDSVPNVLETVCNNNNNNVYMNMNIYIMIRFDSGLLHAMRNSQDLYFPSFQTILFCLWR